MYLVKFTFSVFVSPPVDKVLSQLVVKARNESDALNKVTELLRTNDCALEQVIDIQEVKK